MALSGNERRHQSKNWTVPISRHVKAEAGACRGSAQEPGPQEHKARKGALRRETATCRARGRRWARARGRGGRRASGGAARAALRCLQTRQCVRLLMICPNMEVKQPRDRRKSTIAYVIYPFLERHQYHILSKCLCARLDNILSKCLCARLDKALTQGGSPSCTDAPSQRHYLH